jgi:hypothetical protein
MPCTREYRLLLVKWINGLKRNAPTCTSTLIKRSRHVSMPSLNHLAVNNGRLGATGLAGGGWPRCTSFVDLAAIKVITMRRRR